MGIGSFLSKYFEKGLLQWFIKIELLVGLIGGFSSAILFIVFPLASSFKTNVWYYGDVSIQEVPKLYMKNDSSGQKNYFRVNYYLLINPTLEKYAYYKHFSDTARPVIKYNGSNPPFSK